MVSGSSGRILRYLRELRPWTEFCIVIGIAFGYFVATSLFIAFDPFNMGYSSWPLIYDGGLRRIALFELAVLLMLADFLRLRGWTLRGLGVLPVNLSGVAAGLGLALFACTACGVLLLAPYPPQVVARVWTLVAAPGLSLVNVALVSLINPVFEETFVCGYVVSFLGPRSNLATAVAVSLAIRTSYHFYQGFVGTVDALAVGAVFTACYVRYGKLWPLMVAHALLDFATLGIYIVRVLPV